MGEQVIDTTILTVTGDRHEAFALCEQYMQRQTVFESCQWLVIDDGEEPTKCTLGQTYVRLPPETHPASSFRRNMLVGLTSLTTPKCVIVEDDDSYADRWFLERTISILNWKSLAGTSRSKYYHAGRRMWRVHPNNTHSSLHSTGFKGDKVKRLMIGHLDKHPKPFTLDSQIWRSSGLTAEEKSIIPCSTVISIKGMPGRRGLGIHHRPEELTDYTPDPDLQQLRRWIGDDADAYAKYYTPATIPEG